MARWPRGGVAAVLGVGANRCLKRASSERQKHHRHVLAGRGWRKRSDLTDDERLTSSVRRAEHHHGGGRRRGTALVEGVSRRLPARPSCTCQQHHRSRVLSMHRARLRHERVSQSFGHVVSPEAPSQVNSDSCTEACAGMTPLLDEAGQPAASLRVRTVLSAVMLLFFAGPHGHSARVFKQRDASSDLLCRLGCRRMAVHIRLVVSSLGRSLAPRTACVTPGHSPPSLGII